MPSHKFKVGDIVAIRPTISRFVPGGVFEVVPPPKTLLFLPPAPGSDSDYKIFVARVLLSPHRGPRNQ
jgi:hypothetical protein